MIIIGTINIEESQQLSHRKKIADFEYLYKTIEENYPFLEVNKRVNGVDWLANKERYLEWVEKTAGDGLGSNPLLASLPNSGYVFRFSKDMGTLEDGTCNEEYKTTPHYEINRPYKEFEFEKDKAIQKVLELEKSN